MTDQDQVFLKQHADEIIEIKIFDKKRRCIKVEDCIIILGGNDGYYLYGLKSKTQLIKKPFRTISLAYGFSKSIIDQYSEYLPLLNDPEYAKNFFSLTQYSVLHGQKISQRVNQLNSLGLITERDLNFAF